MYLSLVFILLISFAGAMLESASLQNVKNYRRADMTRAVESIFAEYQKELWEVYGIFALEGSYETGSYSEELLKERLAYYGAGGMNQEITRIQLLTDQGASAFYEQVTAYMENKYGLDKVKKLVGQTDIWKAGEEALQNYERDGAKTEQELQELLSQKEEFPEEENPLSHVAKLKSMPLVDLIMPKGRVMSKKSITLSEMVSHRKRNQGYGDFSDVAGSGSTISKLLFGEYVLEHFKMASDSLQSGNENYNSGDSVGGDFVRGDSANEDFSNGNRGDMAGAGSLDYELEYILEGHASDRENMETVASKLLMVRFVPDYAYIQTDPEKKAEAEAAALTLCTVIGLPELAEGAAQGILLAWAYGEAIMDIRTLISGGKVPLVKNAEDWKLSLSGLMQLGSAGENVAADSGKDMESGLAYREYLRMLLFLKSQDEVGMRTLDMVEQNLKIRYGQTFFRADACISRVEFHSTCNLRRGIMYDFPTYFGYN
ncbi:hypothetical protein DXD84_11630 [Dorea formicigenerans]|mgnify:FL=1|uniref:Uncharacterized protein n=1 Tax=Dorea formicigenerans TaxID=39486 RepID=A0A3E4MGT9_9FIRM|nr:DUF5702 domain-containing protein [Dorea formicigenerans]RGI82333.1 hypothetical protein DXD84_11630 [Dorea formicigenerans]RGI87284.1 hypothetical protein DXD82_08925 [Dorea formicigenerans]RGK48933.1 hypothetical protein DXD10_06390 [Dorea formicigenerans]